MKPASAHSTIFTSRTIDGFVAEVETVEQSIGSRWLDYQAINIVVELLAGAMMLPLFMLAALSSGGDLTGSLDMGRTQRIGAALGAALLGLVGFGLLIGYRAGYSLLATGGVLAGIAALIIGLAVVIAATSGGGSMKPRFERLHLECSRTHLTLNGQTWPIVRVSEVFGMDGYFYVDIDGGELHEVYNDLLQAGEARLVAAEVTRFIELDRASREGGEVPEELESLLERAD